MKAKLVNPTETGKFYRDKELVKFYTTVANTKGGMCEVVKAYVWRSTSGGTVYATLFANNPNKGIYVRGSGKESGCGYHLESAAMNTAIQGAGFKLLTNDRKETTIDSRGDVAIKHALAAITEAMGYGGQIITIES